MSLRISLGSTGLEVSPVAFGTWQLSPRFWGPQPEDEVQSAMVAALDAGINFFDTSDAYGDGLAESVLGRFVAGLGARRDQIVLTTKVFNHYNPDAKRYPDLSPAHIMQRCEASLSRLKVQAIDLYLLHFYDPLTPFADVAQSMERLKSQGKIRHYGVSNFNLAQLQAIRQYGAFNVIQPPYSLLDHPIEADLLPFCQAANVGVMVYSPMHKGLLTGKYQGTETFSDFRQHHADFQGQRFQAICQAVQSLAPMARRYGLSLYQLMLAATLMHPSIQVGVVGIKTPAQIREAAAAMGKTLERADYFAIRSALSLGAASKIPDATGKTR